MLLPCTSFFFILLFLADLNEMGKKVVGVDVLDVEKRRVPSKHYVSITFLPYNVSCKYEK